MKKLLLFTICGLLACADMLRAEVEFPFSRDEYFTLESREVRNINYVLTSVTATKDDELSEEWGLYVWHLAFENADGIKGGAMLTLKNAENAIPAGTYTIEMFGDAEASDGIDEDGNPTGCYIYDPALGESTPYLFVTSGSLTIGYIEPLHSTARHISEAPLHSSIPQLTSSRQPPKSATTRHTTKNQQRAPIST